MNQPELSLVLIGGMAEAETIDRITVKEVMLAAPDILAVDIREPTYKQGRLVQLDAPSSKKNGEWVKVDDDWGMVVGPKRDWVRLADQQPGVTRGKTAWS